MTYLRFQAGEATLILRCAKGEPPSILYWATKLSPEISEAEVADLALQGSGPGGANVSIAASLACEPGLGLLGPSGFSAHRSGRDWGSRFVVREVLAGPSHAQIACHDPQTRLTLAYEITADPDTAVVTISSRLTNNGEGTLDLVEMATACLPIPRHLDTIIGFSGRWADEFRHERFARMSGGYIRENRRGRTSHDSFPAVILCTQTTTESQGEAFGLHLAWSGNHRVRVDTDLDGRVFASLGALFWPGEMRLEPGEHYNSPAIVASYSASGLSALSRNFHRHVRQTLLRPTTRARPRPVHYNTWEAVYFDHDIEKLKLIAQKAAAIGVERFVLDDGWFGGRRNDRAGLGDWTVSDAVYPQGLGPLVDHVTGLGMEMGIWFEPEMVNADSDLYRAHPDWALEIPHIEQVPFRHQYVLDISRPEVSEYLFRHIDAMLSTYAIGYIKWDMNRDLNHPGDQHGRARAHAQVGALYGLIDRVRVAHPTVEIESCSSGGARPDMGILARTDRIWTSDTNDALDRQAIQRGASFFLPLEVLGAHVGPRRCHVTGRVLSMAMRAGTALMGHMGLELNLLTEPESELQALSETIALYKTHRRLLHSGDFHRLDGPTYMNGIGVVSADRREALFSIAMLEGCPATLPGRVRFVGLDPQRRYNLTLVHPKAWWPMRSTRGGALGLIGQAPILGEALASVGLELPPINPATVLIFHLVAADCQ